MKAKVLGFYAALTMVMATTAAMASPILYSDSGIGSGILNGTSFTNQLVTVSFTGDTNNITGGAGFYANTIGTGVVTVGGIGSDTLTGSIEAFVNQSVPAAAGIGSLTLGGSILDTYNTVFGTYALGYIGPTSGSPFIRSDLTYSTSSGTFNLTSMGNTTFEAVRVPLPSTLSLVGGGFGILSLLGWRRKKKAAALAV